MVQMMGLNLRIGIGIEGFFCIVRNTSEYHMKPHWYFSSPKLEQYAGCSMQEVGNIRSWGMS
jgi:hypothetical protein